MDLESGIAWSEWVVPFHRFRQLSEKCSYFRFKNKMSDRAFHNKMVEYLGSYQMYLLLVKSNENVVSHCTIIHEFINYIYNYHLVAGIDQITVSIANSKFYAFYTGKNKVVIPKGTIKKILKDFFIFLERKYGIKNEKLIRGFGITN